jgi:stromal membrane-associated protein
MGVHISRVRSVDLDTWTPEQIEHMQRWGKVSVGASGSLRKRGKGDGLVWGHVTWFEVGFPVEVSPKIDSFIRSKYELKRWAMDGPIPEPEALDAAAGAASVSPSRSMPVQLRQSV